MGSLKISNVSCDALPDIGLVVKTTGLFYVEITIDDQKERTYPPQRSKTPRWSQTLLFDGSRLSENSTIKIEVYAKHKVRDEELIGEGDCPEKLIEFVKHHPNEKIDIVNRSKNFINGTIQFTLDFGETNFISDAGRMPLHVQRAVNKLDDMQRASSVSRAAIEGLETASATFGDIQSICKTWKSVFESVDSFLKMIDTIAEIHPYVKMAWSLLSVPLKVIKAQVTRDVAVQELLQTMRDLYQNVLLAKPLEAIKFHKETASLICQLTVECAWFIQEYASHGFAQRTVGSLASNDDGKIKAFQNAFDSLKTKFLTGMTIGIGTTVIELMGKTDELADDHFLNEMSYIKNQRPPEACLPGTRGQIVDNIMTWFVKPLEGDYQRVFWLHGVAGCGKSAIAKTVENLLNEQSRCVSFYFNASDRVGSESEKLFGTISRYLADLDGGWKRSLLQIIKQSLKVRYSSTVDEQFENFMIRPAKGLERIGPILIIIDALDESGSREQRRKLIKVLERLPELSVQIRFLITSRPEPDIVEIFRDKDWVHDEALDHIESKSTDDDIRKYAYSQLSAIPGLSRRWPNDGWLELLVERAGHLFQWISTACAYVLEEGRMNRTREERLQQLLQSSKDDNLDTLYKTILDNVWVKEDEEVRRRFRVIMSRMLSLREPLPLDSYESLKAGDEAEGWAKEILSPLSALLRGVSGKREPVEPLHASFIDFLKDRERNEKYHVDPKLQDEPLVFALLREMNQTLRFNICQLDTSYKFNADIEYLEERTREYIPAHISYACRFWGEHINNARIDTGVLGREADWFMRRNLLFWLEVLSLIGRVDCATGQLLYLERWLDTQGNINSELRLLTRDALRMTQRFAGPIAQSAPHIYLSVLGFLPIKSTIYKLYSSRFPGRMNVKEGKITWGDTQFLIHLNSSVFSVAFSPDGRRIASGSWDGYVRLWDAATGKSIGKPSHCHASQIYSLAFSSDGKYIVSGSDDKTLRVLDAETAEGVGDPLYGHASSVWTVAISPDSKWVVSGSSDHTLRIWDIKTGKSVGKPLRGHTASIRSIAVSPDGKRIFSGSKDKTIRTWDAELYECIGDPLLGHTGSVDSIACSQNRLFIVSGSRDKTVRIWHVGAYDPEAIQKLSYSHMSPVWSISISPDDKQIALGSQDGTISILSVETGRVMGKPLYGHTDSVWSVRFSPDGQRLVSGSSDNTVRMWDADANEEVPEGQAISAHTDSVLTVVISPDNRRIISGGRDSTVRIWDAMTGKIIGEPIRGSGDLISSIAFSPDGKRIALGCRDNVVRIWNAYTGEAIGETLSGHTASVRAVVFSPNGRVIISGSKDTTLRKWDVETYECIGKPFRGHTDPIWCVAFSPDGSRIVSGSEDCTIRIWDASSGETIGGPLYLHDHSVLSVAISPDGSRIASGSGDYTIRILDAYGQSLGEPVRGHTGPVRSVAFSPNGKCVLSGSDDNTIRFLDPETGMSIREPLQGHSSSVWAIAYSPNGEFFVSGSLDGTIRVTLTRPAINNSILHSDSSYMEDGWMLGPNRELLFWVPPDYRTGLYRPSNRFVIGRNSIRLNFDNFAHGTDWEKCFLKGAIDYDYSSRPYVRWNGAVSPIASTPWAYTD